MGTLKTKLKFGFGCMRLPLLDPKVQSSFDYEKIEKLFDTFIDEGFSYFDTAYTYHGYQAEKAINKALVQRHSRETYQLATKMPLRDFKDEEDLEKIFNEQLQNCGVDFFDYYLLHNMGHNVYEKCKKYDVFRFVTRKKAEGKIKNIGMSFHDSPELLEQILEAYSSSLDFLQLQINYMDWEQPNIESKKCLEIANKYNKPIAVMEPCKGGTLANVPENVAKMMKEYNPAASPASWALRYAADQKGVFMVLSGMNSMEQLLDNTSTFKKLMPLTREENSILEEAVTMINEQTAIACTACEYCTHDCPKKIAIPQYFSLYNNIMRTTGSFSSQMVYYNNIALAGHGRASECIQCGKCEKACPQHLTIIQYLKDVAGKFEHNSIVPTRE